MASETLHDREMLSTMKRLATGIERIADAMDRLTKTLDPVSALYDLIGADDPDAAPGEPVTVEESIYPPGVPIGTPPTEWYRYRRSTP